MKIQFPWQHVQDDQVQDNLDEVRLKFNELADRFFWGVGSPEGVVEAPVGCVYLRLDGGASTVLYVKESGVSTSGWVAK